MAGPADTAEDDSSIDTGDSKPRVNSQVESACTVTLVLKASIAQVTLTVEENRTGKRIPSLALVEADLDTPAQLRIFHPLQHEKRALDAANFAKRNVEAVLAGIAGELADNKRGGHGSVTNGRAEPKYFLPLCSDQFEVELTADQGSERRMLALLAWHRKPLVGEIADAGRKAEAQQMTERKDVIGEAGSVGVVLLDPQIGLMVKQSVENVRGVAGIRGDHLPYRRACTGRR